MKQEAWVTDTSKAAEILNFQTGYTLQDALQETLDWYKEQGWL